MRLATTFHQARNAVHHLNAGRVLSLTPYCSRGFELPWPRFCTATKESKVAADDISQKSTDNETSSVDAKKLKVELDMCSKTLAETKDKYMRALAEVENTRRRMKSQLEETHLFAIQKFAKDLLEVSDNLCNAKESIAREVLDSSTAQPELVSLHSGVVMTEGVMQKIFNKHGVHQINPKIGDKFDPGFHHAMFQTPMPPANSKGATLSPNCVSVVQKIGYRLEKRTLRPALVGVSGAAPTETTNEGS